MADKKLSDIYGTDPAGDLDGTEYIEVTQGGSTKVALAAQFRKLSAAPVVHSTIASNTITPPGNADLVRAVGLSAGLTIANPSGTPADGAGFVLYLEDDGATRSLTWGSKYANSEFAELPAATTTGKRHRLGFEYHAGDDKLYCMYAEVEA